jgi:hypothetical protein
MGVCGCAGESRFARSHIDKFSTGEGAEFVLVTQMEFSVKIYDKTVAMRLQVGVLTCGRLLIIYKPRSYPLPFPGL